MGLPEDVPAKPADQTPVTVEDSAVVPDIAATAPVPVPAAAAMAAPTAPPPTAPPADAPAPAAVPAAAQGGVHLAVSQGDHTLHSFI